MIGGEGSASFTVKIRNTSKYRIEVVKSGGTIDETPFILQSKENVVIDVPENTELILKNKNDAAVHVNVGVETLDKMVRAIAGRYKFSFPNYYLDEQWNLNQSGELFWGSASWARLRGFWY